MATIGYARVSTLGQSLSEQVEELLESGADIIYEEKITGTKRDRPELENALKALRKGDVFMVTKMSRLARSQVDLLELESTIRERGASFVSLGDRGIDTSRPEGRMVYGVLATVIEFEVEVTRERTRNALARRPADRRGGRPRVMTPKKVEEARRMRERNPELTTEQIARAMGVGRTTLLRYLRDDGTPVPRGGHRGGRPPKLTPADLRKVGRLHREGRSLRQIAAAMGCSKSTVQRVLRTSRNPGPQIKEAPALSAG